MTWLDLVMFSIANLLRNKLRTILTIAGVVVGIAAIVFLVSLGFGVQSLVINQLKSLKDLTQVKVEANPKVSSSKIDEKAVQSFKKLKGIKFVSASYYLTSQMIIDKDSKDRALYALEPKYMKEIDVVGDVGKSIEPNGKDEIIVSLAALKDYDLTQTKSIIGKYVTLKIFVKNKEGNFVTKITDNNQIQRVKIVGVTKKVNEPAIFIPIKNLKPLNIPYYDQALIKTFQTGDTINDIKTKLTKRGYKVSITDDILSKVKNYFNIVQIVLGLFGMIALFVASIGIFNTMTISLLERTHEIGVMKAIGATNKDVRRMFILEAAQIGFWGGILGLASGWLFGIIINIGINMLAKNFKGRAYDVFAIPPEFAAIAVFFALAVSLLAGVYPARRAGKLNPLEAIRYE